MQPRHRVSRAAIELIARFEGYRRKAARLPDGRWTIGYGHTLTAREGAEVSEEDAEALLLYDLIAVTHVLNEWVYTPLSQNQFDALASFAFNIGLENFRRSGVLKRLNEGALIQAACAMELWRKAEFEGERIVVDALVRRRAVEKVLFLTPEGGWPAAPSPVLTPLLDREGWRLVPAESPAPVTASLEGERVHVLRADEPAPPPAPPDDDGASPVLAAAEAVASRLQTIFAEPAAAPGPDAEPAAQAAPSPPGGAQTAETAAENEFRLAPPDERAPEPAAPLQPTPREPEGPPSGELFPTAAAGEAQTNPPDTAEQTGRPRVLIDDTAPFEFTAPFVQPLPTQPKGGPLWVVALAILGLAFIGGGLFWAANARPTVAAGVFTPTLVGWLAGLAGVGFLSVAVFLLLQGFARGARDED
ncbi:MAG TPA: glycoside hydrolase family protein [Phenylobacterium sp.]|uniref:lysozyme n=1 Tax=Phenylobacterium sp. TaxID=1871053 RepID=UPI002B5556C5|nr:glycoside hydrolase family protein [Phenylobacterium sp.]HSV03137.1 glycoside hydrolase family protein [Phenylobacterium sp.]